jgi:hypothetical protein
MADASRSSIDIANQHTEAISNSMKLERSIRQLETKTRIAEYDYAIAQDELKATLIELKAPSGSTPRTPKEEQNAKMQERQKYLDLLDARMQLSKAKVSVMRQTDQLDSWLHSLQSRP